MKNQLIIDEIRFYVNDFNGTGVDYTVHAYAQDIDESDQYSIDIYKDDDEEPIETLYADSCGGTTEEYGTEIAQYVMKILFARLHSGIIRGF